MDPVHADTTLARLHAIETQIRAGETDRAAAALNALLAANPADPRIYLTGAVLASTLGNVKQELGSLERAVAVAPHWPPARMELAKALSRHGRHLEAIAAAEHGVRLAPGQIAPLEIAVAVANAAGARATAERHLRAALALRPNDAAIGKALGICLSGQTRYAEAEAQWRQVLALTPEDGAALGWLGSCLIGLGRNAEACAVLERAIALMPENTSLPFHLALARGETPATQPEEMVRQLFDEYAARFDQHLVGQLKYRVPKRVADMLRERRPSVDLDILDLGCGTGLLGLCLGRNSGKFVGVDLSPRMLEHAAKRGMYSELRQADLQTELEASSAESFDAVIANDVFIYVGDLRDVIPETFRVLRPGGTLIFSCETADEAEGAVVLRPSRRYAHARGAIERLCRDAGFASCAFEAVDLRMEGDQTPIAGFIAVAEKA